MASRPSLIRLPLLALAALAFLTGVWGGLIRLGWHLPAPPFARGSWALYHGALVASGFLGTIIALERAVALGSAWAYAAPFAAGAGSLALLAGARAQAAAALLALGAAGFVAASLGILRRQVTWATATMGLGSLFWLGGNTLILAGRPIPDVALWWGTFLVLTIVGERLELTRFDRREQLRTPLFLLVMGIVVAGAASAPAAPVAGARVAGLGLVATAAWLLSYDIARRNVARAGLPRFAALNLLFGYAWLGIAGPLIAWAAPFASGFAYDAALHALFLGFVFSMIFAHAPIIFPAVLGREIAFRPRFYVHFALLHLSLLLRVAGDLARHPEARSIGGLVNALAVLVFLLNTITSVRGRSHPTPFQTNARGEQ